MSQFHEIILYIPFDFIGFIAGQHILRVQQNKKFGMQRCRFFQKRKD